MQGGVSQTQGRFACLEEVRLISRADGTRRPAQMILFSTLRGQAHQVGGLGSRAGTAAGRR